MENIIIDNIEIQALDLPNKISWDDVDNAIESLGGGGWRLPTEAEFATIYHLHQKGTLVLKPTRYWSASGYSTKALYYDFSNGYSPHVADKTNLYYIRLVRSL